MEAGPELDALVAEKVMGWEWKTNPITGTSRLMPPSHFLRLGDLIFPHMHYSTEIVAAWEVVQKLYEKGLIVCITLDRDEQRYGPVECCVEDDKRKRGNTMIALAYALTAPLAICRAALKVVEEDVMCWS